MDQRQKEALINNVMAAIDALIQDTVQEALASKHAADQDWIQELKDRREQTKELLRMSLERLLL